MTATLNGKTGECVYDFPLPRHREPPPDRYAAGLPADLRALYEARRSDPALYSLRNDIAWIDVLITDHVARLAPYLGERAEDEGAAHERAVLINRLLRLVRERRDLVGQEAKTLETLSLYTGRQGEKVRALVALVIEVMREEAADTPEGRAWTLKVAGRLEERLAALEAETDAQSVQAKGGRR